MQNLCILVGVIDGGVDTIVYVAAVDIAIAQCDPVCICCLGHDAVCRNGRGILTVNGEFTKLSGRQI